ARPARGRRAPGPPMNTREPGGLTLSGGTCDLDRQQKVVSEIAPCGLCRHFEGWPVVGGARGNHYVVDRAGTLLEERLQVGRIMGRQKLRCVLCPAPAPLASGGRDFGPGG